MAIKRRNPTKNGGSDSSLNKILIIRHAESTANVKGLLAGRIDPTPLTSDGKAAAIALTPIVKSFNPTRTLVSPMLRCRQTIEHAGILDYHVDDRLIEMDYGKWSGRDLRGLSRRREWKVIQSQPSSFTFPDGESFQDAFSRITNLFEELQTRSGERIVLVSHGDISRMIITRLLGRSLDSFQKFLIEPASHSLLMPRGDGEATVAYLNRLEKPTSKSARPRRKADGYQVGGE